MRSLPLILLLLSGCVTDYGKKSLSLERGMSKDDVLRILGEPRSTSVSYGSEVWLYWSKKFTSVGVFDSPYFAGAHGRLSCTFVDGHLDSWGDQFETTRIMETTYRNVFGGTAEPSPSDEESRP